MEPRLFYSVTVPMMAQPVMLRPANNGRQSTFYRTQLFRITRQVRFVSLPSRAIYVASHGCVRFRINDTNPETWRSYVKRTA